MLKITRSLNVEAVFRLSGRIDAENLGDLEALLNAESGDEIILNLKDLTLVDLDVVRFLRHCETGSIEFRNCPAYIREWLNGEG
jgi:anti-anti-sigma regulatory factor